MQERRQDSLNLNSRVAVLEAIVPDVKEIKKNVETILITMAEQRGAGKAIKVMWTAAMGFVGFIGGLLGGVVRHM